MHAPPPLRIDLAPSRLAARAFTFALAATGVLVAALPVDPLLRCALGIAIACHGTVALAGLRQWPRRAVVGFVLRADRTLTLLLRDGRTAPARVDAATCVTSRLATLAWQASGERRRRSLLIAPDMLDAERFRQLRVLLRYGRSAETAGAPASQARASTIAALSPLVWPERR